MDFLMHLRKRSFKLQEAHAAGVEPKHGPLVTHRHLVDELHSVSSEKLTIGFMGVNHYP